MAAGMTKFVPGGGGGGSGRTGERGENLLLGGGKIALLAFAGTGGRLWAPEVVGRLYRGKRTSIRTKFGSAGLGGKKQSIREVHLGKACKPGFSSDVSRGEEEVRGNVDSGRRSTKRKREGTGKDFSLQMMGRKEKIVPLNCGQRQEGKAMRMWGYDYACEGQRRAYS